MQAEEDFSSPSSSSVVGVVVPGIAASFGAETGLLRSMVIHIYIYIYTYEALRYKRESA